MIHVERRAELTLTRIRLLYRSPSSTVWVAGLDLDPERGEDSECDEVRTSIRVRQRIRWLPAGPFCLLSVGSRSRAHQGHLADGPGPLLCFVRYSGLWAPRPQMTGDASFRRWAADGRREGAETMIGYVSA